MAINAGPNLNSVAAPQQLTLSSNYLDFTSGSNDWSQQYLPDLMEKEAEVFGRRTIAGFLEQVGAEEAMSSDQVVWSEQGRLHLSYKGTVSVADSVITIVSDIDGNIAGDGFAVADHGVRVGDTVLISVAGGSYKGYVTSHASTSTFVCLPYVKAHATNVAGFGTNDEVCSILVYGSDYRKATTGPGQSDTNHASNTVEPTFKSFSNKPIIMKDVFMVSGSDTSSIGWVEVTGEEGQNGYLWYLKAEGDTRARFTDYCEMSMLESVKGNEAAGSTLNDAGPVFGDNFGSEGLFAAIEDRGNLTSGVTGVNAATDLAEFDAILAEFDKQGAIEENMMFVNRATSLAMDDMLASMNSYGAGGTSYGVFNNSEDMALNLGFSGFRRGSYDFYKSDFRYLNDKATRGGSIDTVSAIRGVMIPAGTSTVYDQQLGKNLKRPFLHVRYRASQTESRKFKTWITGSVGAVTSDLDAMQVNYLTERCLIVQGANNFMLMN
jgi:hypothetical protein